jgi:hypothetical protein
MGHVSVGEARLSAAEDGEAAGTTGSTGLRRLLFPGLAGYPGFTQERAVLATFGRPARTYHVGSYTILVWNRNLLRDLR